MRPLTILLFAAICLGAPQIPRPGAVEEGADRRLPSGKSQREEILKADHEKSLEELTLVMKLAEELKIELEKNDRHVLSVSSLKKAEQLEQLSKRIRSRLKRY